MHFEAVSKTIGSIREVGFSVLLCFYLLCTASGPQILQGAHPSSSYLLESLPKMIGCVALHCIADEGRKHWMICNVAIGVTKGPLVTKT